MLDCFAQLVGRELLDRDGTPEDQAQRLFEAPFVVVAHDTRPDPILCYGNRAALALWEVDIETLLRMPSRLTAEPLHRDERARLLARTAERGYVDDYQGIRVSRTGRRFRIEQAIVWNLRDTSGQPVGQAATFATWQELPDGSAARPTDGSQTRPTSSAPPSR
ncbi:MAG: MEKHLA domain-containing protein [Pirellulaceae bacterium]|nr:MEKHLA domain-containing protein [Pirellulaceae bacterium]